ncbi:MAG: hypothetical protein QF402_01875 [Candidatus Latescibacteria bacterium]|nr:hypothetical protein [Candidatus Latescibacterota bacterium]
MVNAGVESDSVVDGNILGLERAQAAAAKEIIAPDAGQIHLARDEHFAPIAGEIPLAHQLFDFLGGQRANLIAKQAAALPRLP